MSRDYELECLTMRRLFNYGRTLSRTSRTSHWIEQQVFCLILGDWHDRYGRGRSVSFSCITTYSSPRLERKRKMSY